MIKPIPRYKLPHTATYKAYTGNLGEGDTYNNIKTLKYVKIEDRKQYKYTTNGRELISNATLFYDYVNSFGVTEFNVNDIIIFNNKEYRVVDIDILYADSDTPHHYEVVLK